MVRTAELAAAAPDLDTVIVSVYIYRDGTGFVVPAVSELVGSFVIKHTHLSLPQTEKLRYLSELPNLAHITVNLIPAAGLGLIGTPFDTKAMTYFHVAKNILEKKTHDRPKSLALRYWPMPSSDYHYYWSPKLHGLDDNFASWNSTDNIEIVPATTPESSMAEFFW